MKILITGITGFVGVNLKEYLNKDEILGVSRKETETTILYENLSLTKFNNSKAFIHLAGKAHDLKKTSEDKEYFDVNTELTKTLYNQFLESTCEVFIYMSSVKAAADVVEGVLNEDVKPNPVTVYGKSKLKAEEHILNQKVPQNKRVYILRPCMIHGPGNKGNLNLLYSFVSKGVPYPFGVYENSRSFLSVENLCFVIEKLITKSTIPSGIYNVADDESLSTNELVDTIGKAINKPSKILKTPKIIVDFIAKIGDFIPIPINSERVQKLTENYEVSNYKIKNAISSDLPLSSKEGLIKTIKSFS